jgi:hypothetical protein
MILERNIFIPLSLEKIKEGRGGIYTHYLKGKRSEFCFLSFND